MKLKTEKELISNWGNVIQPIVSICCIAYNQEKYIEKALKGFLAQKTNFPFEILINDDASTDATANIIRDYESRYPNIVKPLYQIENQKSKVKSGMNPRFNYPRAKGKYIALCDGDDYWTDPLKLHKQVEFLEKNPDYSFCAHDIDIVWENVQKKINFYPTPLIDPSLEQFLNYKRYISILSIVFRKEFVLNFPAFYKFLPGGHMLLINYLRIKGRVYFIDEKMGVHRKNPGSVSLDKKRHTKLKATGIGIGKPNNRFWVNRYEIFMYENLQYEAKEEDRKYILLKLKKLYNYAFKRELANLNIRLAILYKIKSSFLNV